MVENKKPYEMSREEFYKCLQQSKAEVAQSKVTKSSKNEDIKRVKKMEFLNYGVHEFLHKKAILGCSTSFDKLMNGYDLYNEVIFKRKYELEMDF